MNHLMVEVEIATPTQVQGQKAHSRLKRTPEIYRFNQSQRTDRTVSLPFY